MQRKVLMAQLATSDGQVLNPTESILTVEELTRALGQNAAEDRKIFYKVARAVHRGVSETCLSDILCLLLVVVLEITQHIL